MQFRLEIRDRVGNLLVEASSSGGMPPVPRIGEKIRHGYRVTTATDVQWEYTPGMTAAYATVTY